MNISTNTTSLQEILDAVNELPEPIMPETPTITVSSDGLITAIANGKSATKQLPTKPGVTMMPSTSGMVAISAGYYATEDILISGDADLKSDNIKSGVRIFGVTGISWAGTLTFSGTYATSTYYTAAGCSLAVDKDTGKAFVTIQSGTSTSYENIVFTASSLPSGVTLLAPPAAAHGTGGTEKSYFTCCLSGITGKINVAVDMSTRNSSYDYVQAALTVTYA